MLTQPSFESEKNVCPKWPKNLINHFFEVKMASPCDRGWNGAKFFSCKNMKWCFIFNLRWKNLFVTTFFCPKWPKYLKITFLGPKWPPCVTRVFRYHFFFHAKKWKGIISSLWDEKTSLWQPFSAPNGQNTCFLLNFELCDSFLALLRLRYGR